MPFTESEARNQAITTLHKLIESQSIHLSNTQSINKETHVTRAENDVAYLDKLFTGLVDIYKAAP